MKKIDSIRLAVATWIAPAGTAVVPSIARSPMPRPSIAPTVRPPSPVRPIQARAEVIIKALGPITVSASSGGSGGAITHTPVDINAKILASHHQIWTNEVELRYRNEAELLIVECQDSLMWYADKVQQRVQYCGKWPEGWKSREPSGMINIIKPTDAVLVVKR